MRAVKHSPLFRIALLSLAVLTAHTARAAKARPIVPTRPPCSAKVAAAQPDSQKKLTSTIKRITRPADRACHSLSGGFAAASASPLTYSHTAGHAALSRRSVNIDPQRLSFVLRI